MNNFLRMLLAGSGGGGGTSGNGTIPPGTYAIVSNGVPVVYLGVALVITIT